MSTLTSTADYANPELLNHLAEEWHAHTFSVAPITRVPMGEETQEIHARAIAACLGAPAPRRAQLNRHVPSDEQIPLTRLLCRQAD